MVLSLGVVDDDPGDYVLAARELLDLSPEDAVARPAAVQANLRLTLVEVYEPLVLHDVGDVPAPQERKLLGAHVEVDVDAEPLLWHGLGFPAFRRGDLALVREPLRVTGERVVDLAQPSGGDARHRVELLWSEFLVHASSNRLRCAGRPVTSNPKRYEGKPERGFTSGMFYCTDTAGDMSELFPLKRGVRSIELWKTHQYGEECLATMRDSNYNVLEEIKLNRVSRERLEHALAASPKVRFQSTFIDEINKKVSSDESSGHEQSVENNEGIFSEFDEAPAGFLLKCLGGENYVRNLAKSLAHLCFRYGPVEDMHADGKLDDADITQLNKYMVDHPGLFFLLLGLSDVDSLKQVLRLHEQRSLDWDGPDILKLLNDYHISSERLNTLTRNCNQLSRRDCMSESER